MKKKLPFNNARYSKNTATIDCETRFGIDIAIPYDISITIKDNQDNILAKYVLLDREVLSDRTLQFDCFYKDKLPLYFNFISKKNKDYNFIIVNREDMLSRLNDIINKYNITLIKGFNIEFDYKAINRLYNIVNDTIRVKRKWYKELGLNYKSIGNLIHNDFSKVNYFDLAKAFQILLEVNKQIRLEYYLFCYQNEFYTDSGKCIKSSEDIFYKFFKDFDHDEWHLGFKDVDDELELDLLIKQYIKNGSLRQKQLFLNEKVTIDAYTKNGIYTKTRVIRELKENHLI